jgi:hypothetical protein
MVFRCKPVAIEVTRGLWQPVSEAVWCWGEEVFPEAGRGFGDIEQIKEEIVCP